MPRQWGDIPPALYGRPIPIRDQVHIHFLARLVSDEAGQVTKLIGLYIQGRTDESPRDR